MKRLALGLLGKLFSAGQGCLWSLRDRECRGQFKSIGDSVILRGARFSGCARISIGSHVYIGPEAELVGRGGIRVGDHAVIGPGVLVLSSMHNWDAADWLPYDNGEMLRPVAIGTACWLGARSIIMPGVSLGAGCVVGAGAVVTKSWPDGAVLAGNPARPLRYRDPAHLERCLGSGLFYLKMKKELGIPLHEKHELS